MKKFHVGIKAIIHDEDNGYLMLRHSSGWLDFPGGRIDGQEDFAQTITRELSEELPGSDLVSIGNLIGAKRVMKDIQDDISLVLLYFEAKVKLPEPVVLSEEHSEYLWVKTMDDIDEKDKDSENVVMLKKLLK